MQRTPKTHRDLAAWREAICLAVTVYQDTLKFPKHEVFGLTTQIRRSAVSIASNIAEGAGRNSRRELIQFVGIACGSVSELETQLELAVRLRYLSPEAAAIEQTSRVGMLVRLLRKSLLNKSAA